MPANPNFTPQAETATGIAGTTTIAKSVVVNPSAIAFAVEGPAYSSESETHVAYRPQSLYLVGTDGVIAAVLTPADPQYHAIRAELARLNRLTSLADSQVLLPGFSDLHLHAPQWAQAGAALDEPLERWLGRYTFPTEARFADPEYADRAHRHLVQATLARGTTSVLYYDTIDRAAAVNLAHVCAELGQRGFIGKVVMDDPESNPEYYREDTATALAETERFINEVREFAHAATSNGTDASVDTSVDCREDAVADGVTSNRVCDAAPPIVQPVITPRFIPSCTDAALEGLGELAARYHCFTQSHCSESDWEHHTVFERYGRSDTEALDMFGLLTDRTVMHHCVYLSESDADLFARRGAAVAHCPLSNAYFANAAAPVRRYRRQGVTVGLGTDISGGYDPSVHAMVRLAAIVSRNLESGVDASREAAERGGVADALVTLDRAFYLATVGGAEALGVRAGRLEAGYAWDVQLIDVHAPGNDLPIFENDEDPAITFQKIMNLSTPANIRAVWVQGRLAHGTLA